MTLALCEKTDALSTPPQPRWEWVPCNLCGRDDTDIYHRERLPYFNRMLDFTIVRCRSCRLVYTNPRLADHNATYLLHNLDHPEQLEKHARAKKTVFDSALKKIISLQKPFTDNAKPRLLDLGSGSGHFLAHARRRGFDVRGVEPAPAPAQYARENLNVPVINQDLTQVDFPPECFDVITAWDVLEHLGDPRAALDRSLRWLRPGGIFAARFPSPAWQKIKGLIFHRLLAGTHPAFAPTIHLYFFSPRTFARLARLVGLKVLLTRTTAPEPNTDNFSLNCLKFLSHAALRCCETFSRHPLGNLEVYCRKVTT